MLNLYKIIQKYDVIFADVDDTLFNYSHAHNKALYEVLKTFDLTIDDYDRAKREIKLRNLSSNHHKKELYFKVITEDKQLPLIQALEMYELYEKVFNDNLQADSSMINMFKAAKASGKTIVAITNFYVTPQLKKLQTTDFIKYIDFMVTSEEFEIEKPNRKLLDRALKLANVSDLSKVIMFGDSIVDNLTHFDIDYYPYNCSKLLISVSGKSGAGKSTLCKELKKIWNATVIEGDGYHKYERSHPEWKNVTHYNPKANNLIKLGLDIQHIYQNISNINVPIYNHSNGQFGDEKFLDNNSLDVVIIEGLHTLYKEVTGDFVKIKIYIDNELADKQKITRDTTERSKAQEDVLKSISQREKDFNRYIDIQKTFSNFLISVNKDRFKITITDDLCLNSDHILEGNYEDLISTVSSLMLDFKKNRYV